MSSDYCLEERELPSLNTALATGGSGTAGTGTPTGKDGAANSMRAIACVFRGSCAEVEPLLPTILSYVTILELLHMQSVSRRYHNLVTQTFATSPVLNLCQFWSCLGVIPDTHFLQLVSRFKSCETLTLGYCQHLTDSLFTKIVTNIPNVTQITRLDLFYCYNLTDASITLIRSSFPRLQRLNLGRCNNITDRGIQSLGSMHTLNTLNVVHNTLVSEDFLMLLEDPSKFQSLTSLNISNCPLIRQETVTDLEQTRPSLHVRGPLQEFTFDKQGKRVRVEKDKEWIEKDKSIVTPSTILSPSMILNPVPTTSPSPSA